MKQRDPVARRASPADRSSHFRHRGRARTQDERQPRLQELIDEWDWSQRFPPQPELERYLRFVADKLDLRRDIQFSTTVTSADWDASNAQWVVRTDGGDVCCTPPGTRR